MSALDNIAVSLAQVHGYSRTKSRGRALELLERFGLKEEGMRFIIVTHEMGFARHACDKAAFLCESPLLEYGESAQLFSHPETEQLQRFLGKLLEWNV